MSNPVIEAIQSRRSCRAFDGGMRFFDTARAYSDSEEKVGEAFAGIQINNCARMSLMLSRAPSSAWLTPAWQTEMAKIDNCINCRRCASRCPYGLDTPNLLRANLADYRRVLAGDVKV